MWRRLGKFSSQQGGSFRQVNGIEGHVGIFVDNEGHYRTSRTFRNVNNGQWVTYYRDLLEGWGILSVGGV